MKVSRANVSLDLLRIASADNGAGHGWVSKRPCDRGLAGRTSVPIPDLAQAFNECQVFRQPRLMKLDIATSPITRWKTRGAFPRHRAREQSRRHWRINDHADSIRSTERQNFWFDFAPN